MGGNTTAIIKERLSSVGKKINKHWVLKIIFVSIWSGWSPVVVNVFGQYLHLSSASGLTRAGRIVTVLICLIIILGTILSSYASKNEAADQQKVRETEVGLNNNIKFLDNLLSTSRKMANESEENIFEAFSQHQEMSPSEFSNYMLKSPTSCLRTISNEICRCLHEMSSISCDRIAVSVAYKFQDDSFWSWGDRSLAGGGLPLSELQNNPATLFYQMANNKIKSPFVYIENKKDAIEQNMYIEDERDIIHRSVGSLVGLKISIGSPEKPFAMALLFVSTYSCQISQSNSSEELVNIEENLKSLFSIFENKIGSQVLLIRFQNERKEAEELTIQEYERKFEQIEREKSDAQSKYYSSFKSGLYSGLPSSYDSMLFSSSIYPDLTKEFNRILKSPNTDDTNLVKR